LSNTTYYFFRRGVASPLFFAHSDQAVKLLIEIKYDVVTDFCKLMEVVGRKAV